MNTPAPLPPEQLDELLSADLDGEFEPAARDFGLEPAEARQRIAITPGAKERELSLALARAAIADVPALDEDVATRLRAEATAAPAETHGVDELAARRRKRYRVVATAGAVAAAVALVLGIVANANSSNDSTKTAAADSNSRSVSPKHSAALPATVTTNLGEAKTAGELEQRLNLQTDFALGDSTAYNANKQALSGADRAVLDAGAAPTPVVSPTNKELQTTSQPATRCDKAARDLTGVNDPPTVRATGKLGKANVLVYVFRTPDTEIVLILNTKCQFVDRQARALH